MLSNESITGSVSNQSTIYVNTYGNIEDIVFIIPPITITGLLDGNLDAADSDAATVGSEYSHYSAGILWDY